MMVSLLCWSVAVASVLCATEGHRHGDDEPPNIIIMNVDDMGWGDLGVYGHPAKETPNLDKMAAEGMLFTDFYAANPLCSPSRASLLTGRLPIRNGFYTTNDPARNAFTPQIIVGGIPNNETLLPALLKPAGYHSMVIGKWHLGHQPQYLPLNNSFDEFYGSPNGHVGPYDGVGTPNLAMFRDDHMIGRYYEEFPIDQTTGESNLTMMFIEEALLFIERMVASKQRFLLYWAPDSTHTPLYASKQFLGKSIRGLYGDAVMETDYGVGKIVNKLEQLKIHKNTFVFFTSDNGAAIYAGIDAGSSGPFLCGKETSFEGGFREPGIAWWPGKISGGQVSREPLTQMDLFATVVDLSGQNLPTDRPYDCQSFKDLLNQSTVKTNKNNRAIFYYRGSYLMAVRYGMYKAHRWTWANSQQEADRGVDFCSGEQVEGVTTRNVTDYRDKPFLFHLGRDPGEKYPISNSSSEYEKEMKVLTVIINAHIDSVTPGQPQLNWCDRAVENWAPPGCELIGKCLQGPKSNPNLCYWPH